MGKGWGRIRNARKRGREGRGEGSYVSGVSKRGGGEEGQKQCSEARGRKGGQKQTGRKRVLGTASSACQVQTAAEETDYKFSPNFHP